MNHSIASDISEYKNLGNINLEKQYYKSFFKVYEIAFMIFMAYLSLVFFKHGIYNLILYYIVMTPSFLLAGSILEQIDNNKVCNIETNKFNPSYIDFFKIYGTDIYSINNVPNFILRQHIYNKLYISVFAPIVIYISLGIH